VVAGEPDRKHVLFLIPTLTGGGAERVMTMLLRHLDRSRFSLTLAVVDMREAVFRSDIPDDVEVIDLGYRRVRYALPKIIALIRRRRPDVLFSTLGHLNLAMAVLRPILPSGVRMIARETTIVSCGLQAYRAPAVWAMLYRWFYRNCDMVVCQSHYMQKDLVEEFDFPQQQSVVIHNPVDVERIRQLSSAAVDCPVLPPEGIALMAAGRFVPVKGFDLLIEAIALLGDPRVHVIVLGDGPLKDGFQQLAKIRGVAEQFHFVGFQANPCAWFARADAFVLSSRHEGFPNVVLESLACGTPVIATPALGGTREILDGIPGCDVAMAISAPALADAIGAWLRGDRRRVPVSAVEPYAIERIVDQYQQVLTCR